ncbi:cyclin-O [Notothenia coriiceps]|uniref:G2/mitotic-specific cyclin-B2 n=1 Tax=Notothenia coriiceps TaxID=8208 RepID=A0A6I9PN52_9TELE|nr:PREDICTED: cyclin-O [Notothenia coriiceps]
MVSFVNGSKTVSKRRRTICASPSKEALTAAHQRQPARHRKQTFMSKLSDSGFEEDLGSSPISSPARIDVSPLRSDEPTSGRLSNWYMQYGDIGFKIQMDKEARFYSCKSLAHQPQLTTEARCKLVSWLIPVHKHLHLSFECCCLAVNIMDRFMVTTPVAADCFQLLGVTALLLASKQVEVFSPRISHLLSMCCDAFTKEQLCNLECLILLRLNFRLSAPTLAFFLDYYTNCIEDAQLESEKTGGGRFERTNTDTKRSGQCSSLAQKVCELSLADYAFNKYPPSLTASCALRIASELLTTEQGFFEHAAIQLQDKWGYFVDELCTQPSDSPDLSEADSQAVKGHFLYVSQGKHTLAQECKENLLLLVSLNQETMEMMSAM